MKYTCIALDFDDCLGYYRDNREGFWQIFRNLGFNDHEIKQAYDMARTRDSHLTRSMIEELSKIKEISMSPDEAVTLTHQWCKEAIVLFDDTKESLEELEKHGPVAIVTAGNEETQRLKLKTTGLEDKEAFITGSVKTDAIKELLVKYGAPILFVDDKPSVFNKLLDDGITQEEVKMVQIKRSNSYLKYEQDPRFTQIQSLEEVLDHL